MPFCGGHETGGPLTERSECPSAWDYRPGKSSRGDTFDHRLHFVLQMLCLISAANPIVIHNPYATVPLQIDPMPVAQHVVDRERGACRTTGSLNGGIARIGEGLGP
jgi:hypothetical protein